MKNQSLYKNHDGKKHDNNLYKIAVPPDNSHIPLRKDMCSLQAGLTFTPINAIPVISSTNVCNICLPNFNIVCKYILFL